MSDLIPPHLLSNILLRLDVKSLLTFRCVSKPVCALIDSSHFINFHLRRYFISNTNRTVITASLDATTIYHLDFDLRNSSPTFINHPFKHSGAHFLASCNGLFLLLTATRPENCVIESVVVPDPPNLNLALVNPATRTNKLFPVSLIKYPAYYSKTKRGVFI